MPDNAKSNGYLQNLRHMLRALRGRNYALFFVGQGLSLIGTWIQSTALMLMVWKFTHSPGYLGVVGFSSTIFGFLLSPFAGVFSDRWNRRRVLVVTQAMSMLQATLLALLTFTGTIQMWHIVALVGLMGLINALDIPTRQSFVVQMVHRREDLPNAIALNSFIFNGARLIGPMIAGLLVIPLADRALHVPFAGEGVCFVLNAVSYLAVIASLLAMRLPPWRPPQKLNHVMESLREGFRYSFGFPPIRAILLMLGMICFASMPYGTLMPAVAAKSLHHSFESPTVIAYGAKSDIPPIDLHLGAFHITLAYENTYGLLLSSVGVGALIGALFLASRRSVVGLGRMIAIASALLGLGMIGFSLSYHVLLSMVLLLAVGFGMMVQMASSNTILQTIVDDDKRGRVMSFYTMAFQGTAPFGALLSGSLAGYLGVQHGEQITVAIGGILAIASAAAFATRLPKLRRMIHPVYVKLGILSEAGLIPKAAAEEDIQKNGSD